MANQPVCNVQNRSPWLVEVRGKPQHTKRFPFNRRPDAEAYLALLNEQGVKGKVIQLEMSFQLRVRRKGIKVQVITFDSAEQAEQARLKIESELSVSIVRDYATAAQVTLRDIMERYRDEVALIHKGGPVEIARLNRILGPVHSSQT